MIAVDTNIPIRLLTRHNEAQYKKSHALFNRNQIFIPITVLQEAEWVLRYTYDFFPEEINFAFRKVLGMKNAQTSHPFAVLKALDWHMDGADFSDALHLAQCESTNSFLTFDKKLIRRAKSFSTCAVIAP